MMKKQLKCKLQLPKQPVEKNVVADGNFSVLGGPEYRSNINKKSPPNAAR